MNTINIRTLNRDLLSRKFALIKSGDAARNTVAWRDLRDEEREWSHEIIRRPRGA